MPWVATCLSLWFFPSDFGPNKVSKAAALSLQWFFKSLNFLRRLQPQRSRRTILKTNLWQKTLCGSSASCLFVGQFSNSSRNSPIWSRTPKLGILHGFYFSVLDIFASTSVDWKKNNLNTGKLSWDTRKNHGMQMIQEYIKWNLFSNGTGKIMEQIMEKLIWN